MSSSESLLCVFCRRYLSDDPRQAPCGDRLCGRCYTSLQKKEYAEVKCPICHETIDLSQCFRDKAVQMELAITTVHCSNPGCPWEGQANHYQSHVEECEHAVVSCPNRGCAQQVKRSQMEGHLVECRFSPLRCESCDHMGTQRASELTQQDENPAWRRQLDEVLRSQVTALEQQISQLQRNLSDFQAEKLQPVVDAMAKMESTVQQLQEGFGEMALMVQTLQATSYSGTFIWKIPEVRRRKNEAKAGKTISLYSAPFYTGHHGYKLCLRLYMDGDGSGKGTHLSFFLTIMRGEYDALLPWPFRQTVTLMLVDQDKEHDIVQSFRPEPSSSSFQRPRTEMNVASGCPTFARLSVLNNNSYVKDDTMFFKCVIDVSGLESC